MQAQAGSLSFILVEKTRQFAVKARGNHRPTGRRTLYKLGYSDFYSVGENNAFNHL